jgi:hypothetical protein
MFSFGSTGMNPGVTAIETGSKAPDVKAAALQKDESWFRGATRIPADQGGLDPSADVKLLLVGAVAARQTLMQAGRANAIIEYAKSGPQFEQKTKSLHTLIRSPVMPHEATLG